MTTPNDPTGEGPWQSGGGQQPGHHGESSSSWQAPQQPQYGQHAPQGAQGPQYGQAPQYGQPGPQDGAPQWGQPAGQGGNVWQQPQYGGQVPQWQSSYGQGDGGLTTAPRWPRLGAHLIDGLILSVPGTVVGFVFGFASMLTGPTTTAAGRSAGEASPGMAIGQSIASLLLAVLGLAYYGYFDGVKGATPGKRIVNLRLVNEATGQPIGFWRSVLRQVVLGLTWWLCWLGYFSIFFDSTGRDRGWHDLAAGSRVVRGDG